MKTPIQEKTKDGWDKELIKSLIDIGRNEYSAYFFAEMLIKVLLVLQDEN
jgi:hypothetical protein